MPDQASCCRADAVAGLAAELAMSFPLSRERFGLSYPALLATGDTCLLLAADGQQRLCYLLGFQHPTFYANGPVAWVERSLSAANTVAAASDGPGWAHSSTGRPPRSAR